MRKQSSSFHKPALLDIDGAAAYVALSPMGIRRLIATGEFPKPRALSQRRVGWLVRELDAWSEALPVADMLPVGCSE